MMREKLAYRLMKLSQKMDYRNALNGSKTIRKYYSDLSEEEAIDLADKWIHECRKDFMETHKIADAIQGVKDYMDFWKLMIFVHYARMEK